MPDDFLHYHFRGPVGSHWGIQCKVEKNQYLLPSTTAHGCIVPKSFNFSKGSVSSSGRWDQATVSTPKGSCGCQTLSTEPCVF